MTLDCGHVPTPTDNGIGNGVARDRSGKSMCYPCATEALKREGVETGRLFAYVSANGLRVITWNGDILGRITDETDSPRNHRTYYRVTLWDGSRWHGSGPRETGTYVSLRRSKR